MRLRQYRERRYGGGVYLREERSWFLSSATPVALEGVLRHANQGPWNPVWSANMPGTVEALRNHAKALRRRSPAPEAWRSPADAGKWLCG